MAKFRPQPKSKAKNSPPPPADSRTRGTVLFRLGKYQQAIQAWETVGNAPDPALVLALAEAHFRLAVTTRLGQPDAVDSLKRATELAPDDARYRYHLGLAEHRLGHHEAAGKNYARALELGLDEPQLRYNQALLALTEDPQLPLSRLEGLGAAELRMLEPVAALLQGRPEDIGDGGSGPSGEDTGRSAGALTAAQDDFWLGLALLAMGKSREALTRLEKPSGVRLPPLAEEVRRFYLALASGACGHAEEADRVLKDAVRTAERTGSPFVARYRELLSSQHSERAMHLLISGRLDAALQEARALPDRKGETKQLRIQAVALSRLASCAYAQRDWATAARHWRALRWLVEQNPELGEAVPLTHNLAIAEEVLEDWDRAAEDWGAVLNALPRGRSKKLEATGVTVAARRTWLRNRVIEHLRRAGRPDEAIRYFRAAVKADPDNLDLRLDMASALISNDQQEAGVNELNRILERDPRHVGTRLLLAALFARDGWYKQAEPHLRAILDFDPENLAARKGLIALLMQQGDDHFAYREYAKAARAYSRILELDPHDWPAVMALAEIELLTNKKKRAEARLEEALSSADPEAYLSVFYLRLRYSQIDVTRALLERARTLGIASPSFLMECGGALLSVPTQAQTVSPLLGLPTSPSKPAPNPHEAWGNELIDEGLAHTEDPAAELWDITHPDKGHPPGFAVPFARRLVKLLPQDPLAHAALGACLAGIFDIPAAKESYKTAQRLARRLGQSELAEHITDVLRRFDSPLSLLRESLGGLPPGFDDLEGFEL